MKTNKKPLMLWLAAIIFMLIFVVYQRLTGPTHPVMGKTEIAGNLIKYSLLRSWDKTGDAEIKIKVQNSDVIGFCKYRRFKSYDDWSQIPLKREGEYLTANLPHQPPAGKIIYYIGLQNKAETVMLYNNATIIRFTGAVPPAILWTHVIIMFGAMVFAIRALLEAFTKGSKIFPLTMATCIFLFLGGLFLGPIVQNYAFNAYWTGWPFGHDLTDDKTLAGFILWAIALIKTWKNHNHRTWVIIAGLGLIAVYLVPHSVLGSELDYTKLKK
jgi:hypothetical protein